MSNLHGNFLNLTPLGPGVENHNRLLSQEQGNKEAPGQIMNAITLSSAEI